MWAPAFLFAKGTNASPIAPPPSPGGALRSRPKPEDTSPHRTSFAGRVYLTEEICTRRPRGRALRSLSASVGIADQPPREAVATGRSRCHGAKPLACQGERSAPREQQHRDAGTMARLKPGGKPQEPHYRDSIRKKPHCRPRGRDLAGSRGSRTTGTTYGRNGTANRTSAAQRRSSADDVHNP